MLILFTVVLMRTDTVIARVWLIEPYFRLGLGLSDGYLTKSSVGFVCCEKVASSGDAHRLEGASAQRAR